MTSRHHRQFRKAPPPREGGFTLLELMVSTAIFLIGFAGVIGLQSSSIHYNRIAGDISLASNLAANQIEVLRVTEYAAIVDDEIIYDKFGRELDPSTEADQTRYTLTTSVAESLDASYIDVTATVSWSYEDQGSSKSVKMQSRILR